jgi:hypothetical protein
MARQAEELWHIGDNAQLKKTLIQLEQAPPEETAVHELVQTMRRRLAPDPVAWGLWLLTVGVLCFLIFRFVL